MLENKLKFCLVCFRIFDSVVKFSYSEFVALIRMGLLLPSASLCY